MMWQLAQASGRVLKYEKALPCLIVIAASPSAIASAKPPINGQLQRRRRAAAIRLAPSPMRASIADTRTSTPAHPLATSPILLGSRFELAISLEGTPRRSRSVTSRRALALPSGDGPLAAIRAVGRRGHRS